MKKLTDAYPAFTTGAKGPNHWGFEKWKKTMLMAAKQRRPVKAFRRAGLRISTRLLDVSGPFQVQPKKGSSQFLVHSSWFLVRSLKRGPASRQFTAPANKVDCSRKPGSANSEP